MAEGRNSRGLTGLRLAGVVVLILLLFVAGCVGLVYYKYKQEEAVDRSPIVIVDGTDVSGMTEEQANILEAYWNSVRGYTASIDMNVSRIVELLGAGGVNTNPQLQQLELIARNTGAIQSMFNDVILSGHERGGRGIKVFMN